MREIIFRGKRNEDGEWMYGNLTIWSDGGASIDQEPTDGSPLYEVIPETVGQFTGLIDKNGERIFEDDIVTGLFLFGLSVKAVVTFQDGAFGLEWYRGKAKTFDAFTSICNVGYEVIGNIHDTPELMMEEET